MKRLHTVHNQTYVGLGPKFNWRESPQFSWPTKWPQVCALPWILTVQCEFYSAFQLEVTSLFLLLPPSLILWPIFLLMECNWNCKVILQRGYYGNLVRVCGFPQTLPPAGSHHGLPSGDGAQSGQLRTLTVDQLPVSQVSGKPGWHGESHLTNFYPSGL